MKKTIITGADGFVGSNTVQCFLDNGIEVLALDIVSDPNRLRPQPGLTYKCVDIADKQQLMHSIPVGEYDTLVHFAWAGSAGPQRADYCLQMQNALNTVEVLKAAKESGCSRFVCAGSIMEREVEAVVHTQGSRPGMGYIYGMGKHIAHCLCKSVAANIGIDLMWPMITNAYGVGELSPRFVNTTLRKIINKEPLQFTAGTQNYDFVYVTDVARAFFDVARDGVPFKEYIIGSGMPRPLREFILEMQQALAPEMTPQFGDVPFTGTNLPLSAFDTTDLVADCGFKPQVSFAQGTRMTIEWLKTI